MARCLARSGRVLPSQRLTLERRLPVLRKFFQAHEALKNADYRQLFSVPRAVATRELSRLSAQHYLTLEVATRCQVLCRAETRSERSDSEMIVMNAK